ncbi:unnamed protein product [Ilex paraguariensis]|uniref:Uncharacterized protein n=1 Tax=Ilex paraguariensis TaxID=185542 RepID=A0ABC8TBJ2_9AQUA
MGTMVCIVNATHGYSNGICSNPILYTIKRIKQHYKTSYMRYELQMVSQLMMRCHMSIHHMNDERQETRLHHKMRKLCLEVAWVEGMPKVLPLVAVDKDGMFRVDVESCWLGVNIDVKIW